LAYSVHLAPAAERQLKALEKPVRARIVRRLRKLEETPRPQGVEKLSGPDDLYRIREGEYRIIYTIKDKALIVLVVKVGHRKDVYRGLSQ
jgi:mRNA interferase RelE/StbE